MRCAMTRVLPEPAPASMSKGPSVLRTASRCSGLRPDNKSIDVIRTCRTVSRRRRDGVNVLLFHSHTLCEIARLIDVASATYGDVVSKQLQWDRHHDRRQLGSCPWHWYDDIGGGVKHGAHPRVALARDGDDGPGAGLGFLHVSKHFLENGVVGGKRDDRHVFVDQGDRSVFHFSGRVALGMNVRDLLQL